MRLVPKNARRRLKTRLQPISWQTLDLQNGGYPTWRPPLDLQPTFGESSFAVSEAAAWVEARLSPTSSPQRTPVPSGALATRASKCSA